MNKFKELTEKVSLETSLETSLENITSKIKTKCVINVYYGTIEVVGKNKNEVEKTVKAVEKECSKLTGILSKSETEPLEHSDGLDFKKGFYVVIEYEI